MINDPAVAGMITYDEVRFEAGFGKRAPKRQQMFYKGKHEPIIALDLWQKAQKIKDGNRPIIKMPVASRKAPLAGVLRCKCGTPMTTRAAGKGKAYAYYICTKRKYYGRDNLGGCDADRINSDRLHAAFWGKLSEIVCGDGVVERVYQEALRALSRQQKEARPRAGPARIWGPSI